ncbi:MAG TPA: HAD family hydrolase [Kofleriaceae bacterium]|nr:HAD family hydrolase [Kofleriaceae bacterium]
MIAYLFDIDGTLVRAGGAGAHSLAAVFARRHGVADAARGIRFHGRTDRMIVADMFVAGLGRAATEEEIDRILDDYLVELERTLPAWPAFRVLPDADDVLTWLAAQPGVRVGVATGNIAAGARLKLARAGLEHHFSFGGYGCDSPVRSELVACAARRSGAGAGDPVIVVGDTVLDIEAAKANAFLCVAVATGGDPRTTLEAAGADLVLDRLAELIPWHRSRFGG